jgi:acyl transferase domain-containing protein/NADPH:quinone reductase-like Zn-dependent oxidoreductase/acyl carrier protein
MEIAVVGLGCRFPGDIHDPDSLWAFLNDRKCAIGEIPKDRWNGDAFYSPIPDATGFSRSKWGGFINRVFDFDCEFFDISPAEAQRLDPQQRLLLQVAYEAIQDSSQTLLSMSSATTGVFVGISTSDFAGVMRYRNRNDDLWGGSGCALSIAANRISHRLNLKGPSFPVDTACSSALIAIDQACRNISTGMCDQAIAGGVNCLFEPNQFIAFSNANMLSHTGRISTFDSAANGYVRSEGCGLVILRPLEAALEDGERIYAVISSTAANQDGWTSTLMAPSMRAQEIMLGKLVEQANLSPGMVNYVEAHGTGTPTGDPIEAHAIGHQFGRVKRKGPVAIGSSKPNLGHMEPAAGVAGFIKTVLSVYHGFVPPNIHFKNPNPSIPFEALNIKVPIEPTPIGNDNGQRYAVVNSFGWGGANASALVHNYMPERSRKSAAKQLNKDCPVSEDITIVPFSAHSHNSLVRWGKTLADSLSNTPIDPDKASDVAYAISKKRDHFSERAAVLCNGSGTLSSNLHHAVDVLESQESESENVFNAHAISPRKVVFTFSGQGAQWWAMGRGLLKSSDVFSTKIDAFDKYFSKLSGWKVRDVLLANEEKSLINQGEYAQPALIALQIALAEVWKAHGVKPTAVLGHSLGEISAAHIAGAISLEELARVMHVRSRIQHQAPERGAMAVVGISADQIEDFLSLHPEVVISAYNNARTTTISGRAKPLEQILKDLEAHDPNLFIRRLQTDFAWHSELLDYGEEWFRKNLSKVKWKRPNIPFISTVTGVPEEVFNLDYWWSNLRQPVSYHQAINWCIRQNYDTFIEIGPDRTVTPLTMTIVQDSGKNIVVVHSLERTKQDEVAFKTAIARLYVNGVDVDWDRLCSRSGPAHHKLPLFPWGNQTIRYMPRESEAALFEDLVHPILGRRIFAPHVGWFSDIDVKRLPWLKDHKIVGDIVFPAAGFIEIMLAAISDYCGQGPVELSSIHFREALSVKPNGTVSITTYFEPASGKIEIFARTRDSEDDWALRAEAYGFQRAIEIDAFRDEDLSARAVTAELDQSHFYTLAEHHGLNYGPAFQGVCKIQITGDSTSVNTIALPEPAREYSEEYYLHPSAFDSLLQASLGLSDYDAKLWWPQGENTHIEEADERYTLKLPISIDRLLWTGYLPLEFTAHVWGRNDETGVYVAFGDDNRPRLRVENMDIRAVTLSHATIRDSQPVARYLAEQFLPIDHENRQEEATADHWFLIASDDNMAAKRLANAMTARGVQIIFSQTSTISQDINTWTSEEGRTAHILYYDALDKITSDEGGIPQSAASIIENFIITARMIDTIAMSRNSIELVVATLEARATTVETQMPLHGLCHRALIGATRTVANELQGVKVRSIDVDRDTLARPNALIDILLSNNDESEWVLRGKKCFVPRVQEISRDTLRPRTELIDAHNQHRNYSVSVRKPGSFDNLLLREETMPECGNDDVLIESTSVGLNFRDVMATTGVLPGEPNDDTAWWCNLGGEASGTVIATGVNVIKVKTGERVIAYGTGLMRRFFSVNQSQVALVPDNIDLRDAAAVPVAYLTALYCLDTIGHLSKGEKVLIHLGTGGVGLAAIEVAKHIGAEIFTTAGNEKKRQYLRDLGIEHVMDSRDLTFGDEILAVTGGRGVDVILNSLAGSAIDVGLSCLAPFGRFIEIGKRDVEENKPIGLKTLSQNKSYSVVDLSVMNSHAPNIAQKILTQALDYLHSGIYAKIPIKRFTSAQASDAMRLMSRAEHIGKILIDFDDGEIPIHQNIYTPAKFRLDRSYLITGGTSGFGIVLADWLSQNGAGAVHLASRGGTVSAENTHILEQMRARGTRVELVTLDVTNRDHVFKLFAHEKQSGQPIAGIYHAAAVLDDGMLSQQDSEKIQRVVRPKVTGGWNLHLASLDAGCTNEHFVLLSSISEVFGSAGQANYAAANSFLNGLADYRQTRGLSANAVCLGALSETGMVARSDSLGGYLNSLGIKPMKNADVIDAFSQVARIANPVLTFATIDWPALGRAMPNTTTTPRVNALVAASSAKHSLLRGQLASTPRERWHDIVAKTVQDEINKVLKIEGRELPIDQPFAEIGIDSLSVFELKNRIESLADISLSASQFLQTPTIQGVAEIIAEAIEESERNVSKVSRETTNSKDQNKDVDRIVALTDAQRAMLASDIPLDHMPLTAITIIVDDDCDEITLKSAIAALSAEHTALKLRSYPTQTRDLGIDGQPQLVRLSDSTPDVVLPDENGALWQFGLSGNGQLTIAAHPLAGDVHSAMVIGNQLVGHLVGKRISKPEDNDWAQVSQERSVEFGSPEDISGRGYWREMLARIETPQLPNSSKLAYVEPAIADPYRQVGAYSYGKKIVNLSPNKREETMMIAALGFAISSVSGSADFVIERFEDGRKARKSAVGPVGKMVPVVIDSLLNTTAGIMAATERILNETRCHPAFDTQTIQNAFSDELPNACATLRCFGIVYVNANTVSIDTVQALIRSFQLDMPHDLCLHVTRIDDELSLDLLFDKSRVTAGDIRAIGDMLIKTICKFSGNKSASNSSFNQSWRLNKSIELSRETAIKKLALQKNPTDLPYSAAHRIVAGIDGSLPLSMQQKFLLEALQNPQATDDFKKFWWVSRAFRVRPTIDLQRLKTAAALVAKRHDTSRTRFIEADGGFRTLIEASFEPHVELHDFGRVDEDEIVRIIEDLDQETPNPFSDPLWSIKVLRCASDSDVIYVRAHHSVFDGWSTALFIEEMLRALMGQNLQESQLKPADYLNKYDCSHDPRIMAEREEYFRNLLQNLPSVPYLSDSAKNQTPNLDFVRSGLAQELVVTVTNTQKQEIIERARTSGASPSSLLIGAMAQAIGVVSGSDDDVLICVPMAMRHDLALRNYLGWVATIAPVCCKISQHRSLATLGRQIYDQYQTSMLHLPADFTLRRGALHREMGIGGSYLTLFEAGMLTADASRGESSMRELTRLGADTAVNLAGYEIQPIGTGRVRAGCAYHVDIRSFEGPAGHSYRCCYDSTIISPETARNLFHEVLDRLGVSGPPLNTIRENSPLLMDPARVD